MLNNRRVIGKHGETLVALCAAIGSSGCEPLVSPNYLGESRLQLRVSVQNSAPANKEKPAEKDKIVPVLAHSFGGGVRFSPVEVRGDFPADFQVDVFGEPSAEQDAFDALAPGSDVALLYLAAVPRRRIDEPAYLLPGDTIHPVCWDGNCDAVPGRRPKSEPCTENGDSACAESDGGCREGGCALSSEGDATVQLLRDLVGFSQDHVVLYAHDAVPAKSWTALRVGAPGGLSAGYHLLTLSTPDDETQQRSNDCFARAAADYLDEFNAAHASEYTAHALDCLIIPFEGCGPRDAPTGVAAKELASGLAQSEIDHDCLGIAQDLVVAKEPSREAISVHIGDLLPVLNALPAVKREENATMKQDEGEAE